MKGIIIGLLAIVLVSSLVLASGETISWSAGGIGADKILTITAQPSSNTHLKSWIVEGITIPTEWALQSAVFSGGSGMGGQGCAVESGVLNCAAAGSTPADVPTTLTIKLESPSTTSIATINGKYTTTSDDSAVIKSGDLLSLNINGGSGDGDTSGSSSNIMLYIIIAIVGVIIYFIAKKK